MTGDRSKSGKSAGKAVRHGKRGLGATGPERKETPPCKPCRTERPEGDHTGKALEGQARKPGYSETRPRRMAILVSSLMELARNLVSTLYLWVSTVLGLMLRASPIWRTL